MRCRLGWESGAPAPREHTHTHTLMCDTTVLRNSIESDVCMYPLPHKRFFCLIFTHTQLNLCSGALGCAAVSQTARACAVASGCHATCMAATQVSATGMSAQTALSCQTSFPHPPNALDRFLELAFTSLVHLSLYSQRPWAAPTALAASCK